MVKFALILPALLPLLALVSGKHKHAEVHVRGFVEDECEANHPGSSKAKRHEIENDGQCEHSWKYQFKSVKVDYDYERPWNPKNLECFLDFYSDRKCKTLVGSQNLDEIREDCANVNATNPDISAVAAKLNCRDGKHTSLETQTTTIASTATLVAGPQSPPIHTTTTTSIVCKPTTFTSTWTSCYVPSLATSATTITDVNYTASPSTSVTTSSTTFWVAIPTTVRSTSSSTWTLW
ncbi:MAG: hypothetical protein M1821_001616 [Bathelium mastoideum]|nr:MAG: hypothetical protein M1821_001616 [Bathelium mastoideum]KAI9691504.1 MAG: hypothetical protein M1822_007575 [Bathelium mastoideum]